MRATSKWAVIWMASTAWPAAAYGQSDTAETADAGPAVAQADSGEIVITAQRREERLIDVPIAVSAVNAGALDRAGVQTINNVQSIIPNVQINQTPGNSFSPVISIRGLAPSADTSLARDQPVGLYLDGVPIAKSTGAAFDTVDLERIEVLRGPQGTLYGKNTIGGAVNLITRAPTGEFGGQLWLSFGEWGRIQRRLSVDLPEIANFSVRLSYSGSDQNGYWRNAATGGYFGEQSMNAGRVDVMWRPSDNFSARYVYDISDARGTPTLLAVSAVGAALPAVARPLVAPYVFDRRPGRDDVSAQSALRSDFRVTGHALTLDWDVAPARWVR